MCCCIHKVHSQAQENFMRSWHSCNTQNGSLIWAKHHAQPFWGTVAADAPQNPEKWTKLFSRLFRWENWDSERFERMECYLGTFCYELGACLYFSWNDFGNNLDGFSMLCGCHTDVSSGRDPVLSVATWQFFTTGHMGCLISGVGRRQQGGMRQTHVAGSGAVSGSDIREHVVSRPPSEWS